MCQSLEVIDIQPHADYHFTLKTLKGGVWKNENITAERILCTSGINLS